MDLASNETPEESSTVTPTDERFKLADACASIPAGGGRNGATARRRLRPRRRGSLGSCLIALLLAMVAVHAAPVWPPQAFADEVAAAADADGDDRAKADEGGEDTGFPGEFAAEAALVSDYVDRGISNTDGKPAVQGGITYSIETGVGDTAAYAGVWGSNVDFDDGDGSCSSPAVRMGDMV